MMIMEKIKNKRYGDSHVKEIKALEISKLLQKVRYDPVSFLIAQIGP